MALKYVVKKTTFGFDKTKAEKYVARPLTIGSVTFPEFCDQVTKVGMAPRGVVKLVLDGAIDVLRMNIVNGLSVSLGDFGSLRPSFGCQSQNEEEKVDFDTLRNRKIIFVPGTMLKDMIRTVSIRKFELPGSGQTPTPPSGGGENPDENPDIL